MDYCVFIVFYFVCIVTCQKLQVHFLDSDYLNQFILSCDRKCRLDKSMRHGSGLDEQPPYSPLRSCLEKNLSSHLQVRTHYTLVLNSFSITPAA